MLSKLQNHISTNFSFLKGKKLLLAISGGVDSMVLLHLCHQMNFEVGVAHCNFQLRGVESDTDENFVITAAEKLQIPIFVTRFDTQEFAAQQKLSIQIVARKLRYDWFETLLQNENYDYLVTAHHLDDSLETFLINFTRGTGLDGLTGIPPINDSIIRPLLIFSRDEILAYAQDNQISWREDSSNASDKYFRNKLRHNIIPILKELNPSLLSSFENTITHLQQAQTLVEDASKMVYAKVVSEHENQIKIAIDKLLEFHNYKAYLYQWLHCYGFSAWEDIYELLEAQSGKKVFSKTHVLLKDRDSLILYKIPQTDDAEVFLIEKNQKEVKIPLKLSICAVDTLSNQPSNTIFADEEKLVFPLTIRKWKEGDEFYPFGMTGKKKLSKYFKDEKLSLYDKSNTWLLCSNNQIVWVIGKRQDDRFKITETTTKIIKIKHLQ